jgi:hypothetical protein
MSFKSWDELNIEIDKNLLNLEADRISKFLDFLESEEGKKLCKKYEELERISNIEISEFSEKSIRAKAWEITFNRLKAEGRKPEDEDATDIMTEYFTEEIQILIQVYKNFKGRKK